MTYDDWKTTNPDDGLYCENGHYRCGCRCTVGERGGESHCHDSCDHDSGDAEKVREIKRRLRFGDTKTAIAADYGVDRTMVSAIARGKCWTWVQEDGTTEDDAVELGEAVL